QPQAIWTLREQVDLPRVGGEMMELMRALYPICRSITGQGLRETLGLINQIAPLDIREIPTGTHALDWIVPKEWNIKEAYIADRGGRRVIDFKNSNLHVLGYS